MKLWRYLKVWWKRWKKMRGTNPLPVFPVRQDLETRVVQYEIDHASYVVEYRTPECGGVWIRLTRAYVATENPRHWSLVHPWLFPDNESASVVAGTMNKAWVHRHLVEDREQYHALKTAREEEIRRARIDKRHERPT